MTAAQRIESALTVALNETFSAEARGDLSTGDAAALVAAIKTASDILTSALPQWDTTGAEL